MKELAIGSCFIYDNQRFKIVCIDSGRVLGVREPDKGRSCNLELSYLSWKKDYLEEKNNDEYSGG